MKKKVLLLIIGVLIGVLAFAQIFIFNSTKATRETSKAPTEIELIQQNNIMFKTVAYYVLSFIKHQ